MVEQQIRPWEVLDFKVLEVLKQVARDAFVPERYRLAAYADLEIPLPAGQSMLKPVVEGRILQSLALDNQDQTLLVGAGSGYLAACMAELCAHVHAIDCVPELCALAQGNWARTGVRNVSVSHSTFQNFKPTLSFDAIAFTGAVHQIDPRVLAWLKPGGRIFVVHGKSPAQHADLGTAMQAQKIKWETLFETDLGYLVGAEPPTPFTL
jgi:protein-L-isoaspartate(D-aspartate) O-methyltransferase